MSTQVIVLAFWLAHGFAPIYAGALTRQAGVESGFDACADAGAFKGLYQWGGARLAALTRFAGMSGCPPLHTQLEFAYRELATHADYRCFLSYGSGAAYVVLRRTFGRGEGCR